MKDESTRLRRSIWGTNLGIRAKLTLIALWEVGDVEDGILLLPPSAFRSIAAMTGKKVSSVVGSIQRLKNQNLLEIIPTENGYRIEFHFEREIRNRGGRR